MMEERPKREDFKDGYTGLFDYAISQDKYIDQLEAEVKQLKEKIKRVEDSLMSDDIMRVWKHKGHEGMKKQRDLTLKALTNTTH